MAMEERTTIIRSLDHIGAAAMRLRGDTRLADGEDVCARQEKAIKRDKPTARGPGNKLRRNFLN